MTRFKSSPMLQIKIELRLRHNACREMSEYAYRWEYKEKYDRGITNFRSSLTMQMKKEYKANGGWDIMHVKQCLKCQINRNTKRFLVEK